VKSETNADPLARIRSEIHAEADAARQRAPLPERVPYDGGDASLPLGATPLSLAAIAAHAGPAFVDAAYRAVLMRAPDAEGHERLMAALGAGTNKIELLGDLRYSAEGRRHGAAIAGLAPRYALAKLGRIPLLGALVRWCVALASLPHVVRHQRATEASLAVQFGETRDALHALVHTGAELRIDVDRLRGDLASAVEELSARQTKTELGSHEIRLFIESLDATVGDLRQLTLAMNHWTTEVRRGIDTIEADDEASRIADDAIEAAAIDAMRARDPSRATLDATLVDALSRHLAPGAKIVDLCGGGAWLAALAARGFVASSIETNAAIHRAERERALDATFGDPRALLARAGDASLDAIAIDFTRDLRVTPAALLREAHRVVRSGGMLVIVDGVDASSARRVGIADLVRASGFVDASTHDVPSDRALIAVRP
jgi:hypothetical protein